MTDQLGPQQRRYSAFISYTDTDRNAVARLQSRLERYRLPPRLAEQRGFDRLKPVFVDRSEMRAAPDLSDAIRDALARSDFLIVACTPRTPASHWVGIEIDAFRELRADANVIVALLEGQKQESFHPRLYKDRTPDCEPLAADFRPRGDGYRLALLKIVATLVDVDLDELVHRDARRQRRRTFSLGSLSAAVLLTIAVLAVWAYTSDRAVDQGRIEASLAMTRQLDELREQIEAGGTLDMAAAVNRSVELYYDELPETGNLPEVELGRTKLLHSKTQESISRGELDAAAADARTAWNVSARVLAKEPDDPDAIFVHAQSAYWLGYVGWLEQDTPLAANAWARYADLADRLVRIAPTNDEYRLEQGYAYSNLGVVALREARDPERADRYFTSAQAAFREVARRNPGNPDRINELADGESWLADVDLARGDFAAARRHRDTQARMIEELLDLSPRNLRYRAVNTGASIGRARLYAEQGHHAEALRELAAAYAEATTYFEADPANVPAANRKRAIELFQAQSEIELDRLSAAGRLIGDCTSDWARAATGELSAFCSILSARVALHRGQLSEAARIMADTRLSPWLKSPSLSPTWRFDFQAECRKLGRPELCRVPRQ